MKHFHLFKRIALACGMAAAAALVSSCTTTKSVPERADQFSAASNVTIFSYNDASSPSNRLCTPAGPMPENAYRALKSWLANSTIKDFTYAYPQYYVAMTSPEGKQRVWGICTDGKANLVGVLIPRDGVAAWDLPFIGAYKMYVCDTKQRRALSDAIMTYLSEAGYDATRLEARKAAGLVDARYLMSKPVTLADEAAAKAAAEAARAAEAAAAAAAKAAAGADEEGAAAAGDEEAADEEGTEEEESSDEEEETEEESSDEEEETEEESSDEEEETEEEEE
ncbi:MAG: hypothetical protein IKY92_05300 [Akkermansia sp.]|nr:hypothetical protein [Akkermansia sp.]